MFAVVWVTVGNWIQRQEQSEEEEEEEQGIGATYRRYEDRVWMGNGMGVKVYGFNVARTFSR